MATLNIPNNFVPGTKAEALKVTANFDSIINWSTTLDVDNFATLTGKLDFNVGTTKAVEITNTGTQPSIDVISNGNSTGLVITDIGTNSSLTVTKSGQLAAGKAIILITDAVAQIDSTAAVLKMALSSSATIPAIDIVHGAAVTFQVKKTHLVVPSKTTAERDAIVAAPVASVLFNSTIQELQFNTSSGWSQSVPTGSVQTFAGFIVPGGWLLCDNTPVNRINYASLFAVLSKSSTGNTASGSPTISVIPLNGTDNIAAGWFISGPGIQAGTTVVGTTSSTITLSQNATANGTAVPFTAAPYGIGNGTTTFNVPDMRRRVVMGSGGTGTATVGNLIGNIGGSETHTLSAAELQPHSHPAGNLYATVGGAVAGQIFYKSKPTASWQANLYVSGSGGGTSGFHTESADVLGSTGYQNLATPAGPHNNVQAAIILNYIIKT